MSKETILKTALIQIQYLGSKDQTVAHSCDMIKQAAREGAKLIILPELHQNEYFPQIEDTRFFEYAAEYEKDKKFWSTIAKENSVVLVTSLFEQRARGLYHNTAVVFDSDGSQKGIYRKMHIPDDPNFYEKFYFTPGDLGFNPIQTSVGNLGVMICWDQWFSEGARLMALKGADILIYPTAIGWMKSEIESLGEEEKQSQMNSWITVQRGHSVANNLPVLAVNRVGVEIMPDTPTCNNQQKEGIQFWGNSFATDTRGNIVACASSTDIQIVYTEIDFNKIKQTRDIWPFFRDRRIEHYQGIGKLWID
jgi:N-carbamoylputrescine amidase